ncbi:putative protein OS=Tsukamurella paurometabola (strain ATCC 8368 / DSM / CCUG 35730 /CIP 100753 / JCM 10117 / KCTC 9821 / NBRC 16120 / NCIMB 702349/ NCTC 13040) OX=521096 GN=Tpau_2488 PE=4 SV=1 [Tsukamurella paurometabola]|uniref:Uncharacterized protein n=1 Tax=Tsukamurella paurometabola (strain ATCC 8368 / DSM 20162 / CCUG 35730 / CIP 100753 / JCM 10117 / KCTC 9821 / NBRC 16120 / NCIMB 702349 / NCTC 13040) TaxID=521096 RepID=D5URN7_TSUPD|nr:hypothetical protein [Tsukamurella paurometabola]ADG79092.1 hypothetical protein Tpau_2488 [Tsukamurella paurometabola DSM 20162]SUP34048.1 Uncharacterised protein [Tsukamurella paurometabola]
MTTPETTDTQPAQERPIPTVPEGTPGRDWRAALPAAQPPGAQQPWRRLGPGNRAWVVVITVIALVIGGVLSLFAVGVGTVFNATTVRGAVLLESQQYSATQAGCIGAGPAQGVEQGATITISAGDDVYEGTLGEGRLRQGRCQLGFDLTVPSADPDRNYAVSIGSVRATSVSGAELSSTNPIIVFVAPR